METDISDAYIDELDRINDHFFQLCQCIRFESTLATISEKDLYQAYYDYKKVTPKGKELKIFIRGFVFFPPLLKDFLDDYTTSSIDLACMICRCIEYSLDEKYQVVLWHSLKILIEYITGNKLSVNLLLLTKKYNINWDMYEYCKDNNIIDKYLDTQDFEYTEILNVYEYESHYKNYFGYRNIYHGLQYAPTQLFEKQIDYWLESDHQKDCTYTAFLDYFYLEKNENNIRLSRENITGLLNSRSVISK